MILPVEDTVDDENDKGGDEDTEEEGQNIRQTGTRGTGEERVRVTLEEILLKEGGGGTWMKVTGVHIEP